MGHDFGEVRTDRDREERGEEVLVTVREYKECDRCGQTRVISENKEVRTTAEPDPVDEDDAGDRDEPAAEADGNFEDVSAEEDDGVILPEESDADREPGEWPEEDAEAEAEPADAEESDDPTPWPEVEGEDEGYAAEPSEGGPADDVDFGGGLTPESAVADSGGGAAPKAQDDVVETTGDRGSSGIRRARPSPEPTDRQREADPDAEFYCPECEYTAPSDGSSLRPGDICPECRLGYLTERTG